MKFAIVNEHHKFFEKNQLIEFESFLSEDSLTKLNDLINTSLQTRLKPKPSMLKSQDGAAIFSAGRDLWRENHELKKLILQKQSAELASELTYQKSLRFACDQLFVVEPHSFQKIKNSPYSKLMTEPHSLEKMLCFQGIVCGLFICLSGTPSLKDPAIASVFPHKPGNAVYFMPQLPIDFSTLSPDSTCRFLLMVYSLPKSLYILQEHDPNTHILKRLGYVFGDALKDRMHPILCR